MLVFDVAQFDGILKKITEFHNSLLSDPVGCFTIISFLFHHCGFKFLIFISWIYIVNFAKVKKDLSLSELEISRLGAVIKILKDTSHYHTSRFADADIALLLKLLKSWPLAMIFPGQYFTLYMLLIVNLYACSSLIFCDFLYIWQLVPFG